MLRRRRKGQTSLEYIVLIIIVIGALLAMGNYFKRSLQGRWKGSLDELGDQYDPRTADSVVRHTLTQSANTIISTEKDALSNGYWTKRKDASIITERKQGNVSVGAY